MCEHNTLKFYKEKGIVLCLDCADVWGKFNLRVTEETKLKIL
jgi:hypothetical protein